MPNPDGIFAADVAALFRDPGGVTELRGAFPGDDDTTLSSVVFLGRCAARNPFEVLEPAAAKCPGNLISAARWVAITAMAEPWLGAVKTWHETSIAADLTALGDAAEHALYWRMAAGWPISGPDLDAHLQAWPLQGSDADAVRAFAERLCADASFAYTFDGAVARVAEIAERASLNQLVLRMTLPGDPVLYPEDLSGQPALWLTAAARTDARRVLATGTELTARSEVLGRLQALRATHPTLFEQKLLPVPISVAANPNDRVCCFRRGENLLTAVTVGDRATGACGWELPAEATGHWRDVLTDRTHELPDRASLAAVLGPDGRAVLVRE